MYFLVNLYDCVISWVLQMESEVQYAYYVKERQYVYQMEGRRREQDWTEDVKLQCKPTKPWPIWPRVAGTRQKRPGLYTLTYAVTRHRISEERLDLSQSQFPWLRQTLALLTTGCILVAIFPGAM